MFTFVLTMKMMSSLTVLLIEYFGTRIEYCVEGTVKKLRVFASSSSSGQKYMGKEWKLSSFPVCTKSIFFFLEANKIIFWHFLSKQSSHSSCDEEAEVPFEVYRHNRYNSHDHRILHQRDH